MATFKEFTSSDISSNPSFLNQMVDIINTDISSSDTRRKYQVFVTGGVGPGVTSSLFQTIYDQDFTLQTANPIFDMTVGLFSGSQVVLDSNPTIDINGKYLFPQETLMMREKMDIYRQFAQSLLGDANAIFTARVGATTVEIKEALFLPIKRLFARDQIKRETFAIRLFPTGSSQLWQESPSVTGAKIYTDINSVTNKEYAFGGQVSTIVDSADLNNPVGLLYIDKGILVLDLERGFDQGIEMEGDIDAVNATGTEIFSGSLNSLLASASIDNIVDHLASTRFGGTDETAIVFQNVTNINSTLFAMRLAADEFNYSSNPTYTDENNRIVVIDEGQEETQQSFTFVTSVGLYDAHNNLLAVGKLSRPVLKNNERDLTFLGRLDY